MGTTWRYKGGKHMIGPSDSKVPTVLYAEDEDMIGNTLADILQESGFEVHRVVDGVEAVEASATRWFDLLLTDLDMPRMNGCDLIRCMRAERPDLPVVVLTGNPPLEGLALFTQIGDGPTRLLSKPTRLHILVSTLHSALSVEPVPAPAPVQAPTFRLDILERRLPRFGFMGRTAWA